MSATYEGSSGLTASILGSVTQVGETAILAQSPNSLVVPGPNGPIRSLGVAQSAASGTSTIAIALILIVVAFFAYREL